MNALEHYVDSLFEVDLDLPDTSDEPTMRDVDRARAQLAAEALTDPAPNRARDALAARLASLLFSHDAEGPLGMSSPIRMPTLEEQEAFFASARRIAWREVRRLNRRAVDDRAAAIYRRECGAL
jgi:hypothetical protein